MVDLYDVLGVSKDATADDIKKAHRKLAKKYHPDRNIGDEEAANRFKEIQDAYDILSDPSKRSQYDQFGRVGKQQPYYTHHYHASTVQKIFEEFFGGASDRGRNVQIRISLDLKEALQGGRRSVKAQKKDKCPACEGNGFTEWHPCSRCSGSGKSFVAQPPFDIFELCPSCRGTGRSSVVGCSQCEASGFVTVGERLIEVGIPPGADTGMQIRVSGMGEPGKQGARNGDLYVVVVVKQHDLFTRDGTTLHLEVPISYTQLVLGSKIKVPTLDGHKIELTISPGTQDQTEYRFPGLGMPDLRGRRGELVVIVKVEVPSNIDDEYKNIIQSLARLEEQNITPLRAKFFKEN